MEANYISKKITSGYKNTQVDNNVKHINPQTNILKRTHTNTHTHTHTNTHIHIQTHRQKNTDKHTYELDRGISLSKHTSVKLISRIIRIIK